MSRILLLCLVDGSVVGGVDGRFFKSGSFVSGPTTISGLSYLGTASLKGYSTGVTILSRHHKWV